MNHNIYQRIADSVRLYSESIFLQTECGDEYRYADFDLWTARYAAWLANHGVKHGDRVLVQAEKSAHVLFLCYACIRMGAIFVPISTSWRRQEIEAVLKDSQPSMVICDPRRQSIYQELRAAAIATYGIFSLSRFGLGTAFQGAANFPPELKVAVVNENAPAALMYTSGTSGRAKAAIITHQNILANGESLKLFWTWSHHETLLHTLPLYHLHGLFVAIVPSLLAGSKIVLHRRFTTASAIAALHRVTIFMGVPTYFERLLASPLLKKDQCSSIRLFISGSAPLRPQTSLSFKLKTGHEILERYGMTESGGVACTPIGRAYKPGSIAVLPGFTVRIGDEIGNEVTLGEVGEVQMQGKSVFPGYWNMPDETSAAFTADGYLRSGDLGRRLADDSYQIVGRIKDIIISNGENVNPLEVEHALDRFPDVAESAVVGIPDDTLGEAVVAVVVLKKPTYSSNNNAVSNDLRAVLKRELSHYKVPKRIVFRASLPRNAMGKVQKNLLRSDPQLLAKRSATEIQSASTPS